MKYFKVALLAVTVLAAAMEAKVFHVQNNCGYTVWPGILSNSDKGPNPANGGFELKCK